MFIEIWTHEIINKMLTSFLLHLRNVKNIQKLSQRELELGVNIKQSWHQQYRDSAWVFLGGLNYELTEGDIICVFSQYGEVRSLFFPSFIV